MKKYLYHIIGGFSVCIIILIALSFKTPSYKVAFEAIKKNQELKAPLVLQLKEKEAEIIALNNKKQEIQKAIAKIEEENSGHVKVINANGYQVIWQPLQLSFR